MSELDIEALKRRAGHAAREQLSREEWEAIIAALEDRERLRAAGKTLCDDYAEPAVKPSVWKQHFADLAAALEGRDA